MCLFQAENITILKYFLLSPLHIKQRAAHKNRFYDYNEKKMMKMSAFYIQSKTFTNFISDIVHPEKSRRP